MHVLRDAESIDTEIRSCADPHMKQLIADRAEFVRNEVDSSEGEYDDVGELINFILVEPGDTPQDIDAEMDGTFLITPYGGRRFGDPAFVPPFETMEEHPTFYDMEFIQSDEGFSHTGAGPQDRRNRPLAAAAVRRTRHAISGDTGMRPGHSPPPATFGWLSCFWRVV